MRHRATTRCGLTHRYRTADGAPAWDTDPPATAVMSFQLSENNGSESMSAMSVQFSATYVCPDKRHVSKFTHGAYAGNSKRAEQLGKDLVASFSHWVEAAAQTRCLTFNEEGKFETRSGVVLYNVKGKLSSDKVE